MKLIIIALAIVLGSVGLHVLALWMERKGWIYYKHNQPSRSRLGNAFLEVQSILEPNKKHIIEIKKGLKRDNAEPGKGDALIKLLLEIRKDIGISQKDNPETFNFHLIGRKPKN